MDYEQAWQDLYDSDNDLYEWIDAEWLWEFLGSQTDLQAKFIEFLRGNPAVMLEWERHINDKMADYAENQANIRADQQIDEARDA